MSKRTLNNPIHTPGDFTRENIEMLKNVTIDLTEANRQLYALRIEAVRAAFEENSSLLKFLLKNVADTSATIEQWSTPLQAKLKKLTEISNAWSEITSQAISGMGEVLSQSFSASGAIIKEIGSWWTNVPLERRVSASLIAFPERRAAVLARNAASGIYPTAKKQRVA